MMNGWVSFFVDFSLVIIHDPLDPEFFLRTDHILHFFCRLFLLHTRDFFGMVNQ